MTTGPKSSPRIAIACGGTGGHLFPGLAIADQLLLCGCEVLLLVSTKDVDQQVVKAIRGVEVITLPAVGLTRGRMLTFTRGFFQSYRTAKRVFSTRPPAAALAMGGFTSAAPILAAKRLGERTFLHESNIVPGRANRWLSWLVDQAFVGFPATATRLHSRHAAVTGTPVRAEFRPRDVRECRAAVGLDPVRPVVLVIGGSQGARGINELIAESLPLMTRAAPQWQWFHLSGAADLEFVRRAYARSNARCIVLPFFAEMALALGAATGAVSRAGASSLAELAAMRLPAILVPYPSAADNHQFHNAHAFADSGAARLLPQKGATAETLASLLTEVMESTTLRARMQSSLGQWHAPDAAENIARTMLQRIGFRAREKGVNTSPNGGNPASSPEKSETYKPKCEIHPRLEFT